LILVDFPGFPAEKRNYGYNRSHGSLILFLDEDEYLVPQTIAACVKKFRDGADIVGIPRIKPKPTRYMEKCISMLKENPPKGFLFFKRDILEEIGLFRTDFILCDDVELEARASHYKHSIIDVKDGYILHDETNSLASDFRKRHIGQASRVEYAKKYGIYYDAMGHRKRIAKYLIDNPSFIPGVLLTMLVLFLARRAPYVGQENKSARTN
jgi:glycosyltransferase involved in cell wall biosynthesis